MKKLLTPIALLWACHAAFAQTPCNIQAFANPAQIYCGQEVELSAFGNGSGNVAFQENFNSGSPVGWQFTQTVTIANNTCGRPSPDGSNFMWMGDASVNPRDMTTVPFDLTLGGTICFDMRYAIQGGTSPCEGPDEPQEGVYVQYSTNNGATWTTIQYWNPNGGNNSQLTNWNQYCLVLPAGAMTANTMIRWHQDNVSGAEYDHWGIDNVVITLNDPNYIISWNHDGYSYGYGSSGGVNPALVTPLTTTTYQVQITDGNNTCTDNVQVVVNNPVIIVSAGNDTTICPGECVNIDATAYWEIEAPGSKRFVNDISQTISAGIGGGPIRIPVSVGGVNLSTIQPGSIMEVCITNMSYFGQNIFPPSTLTIGSFAINLTCPSGASIQLVPSGVTTSTFIFPGYVQTCFTMAATTNIATGAPPYTNTFAPSQPFNNLVGCPANGQWEMSLVTSGGLGIGTGNFGGWSITFDDPGLTAPVTTSWSPTNNMTGANTLNPTVCPNFTTTYTLTATNHPGCLPQSDNITITVPNTCCQLQLDDTLIVQPTCAGGDGRIEIQVSGDIAGLRFSIDNGVTFQSSPVFSGLSIGTYYVLVNDNNDCPVGAVVVLSNANAPSVGQVLVTGAACGANDGSVQITATGGTPPLQYSIDNGVTFQASDIFQNLAPGNYSIVVRDNVGCSVTSTANVTSAGNISITNVVSVNPACGASDGNLSITASGSGIQYSINGGTSFQSTGTFPNLASGTYNILVRDNAGCTATDVAVLNDSGSPVINGINVQHATCNSTGSLTVNAVGGAGIQYSIDGATFQNSSVFTGLAPGNYTITVDENGCQSSSTAVINGQSGITLTAQTTDDGCGDVCAGVIQITATGGTAPYSYLWGGNISSTTSTATGLCRGNYTVTVSDISGCIESLPVTVGGLSEVTAEFSLSPNVITLPNGIVQINNLTQGADAYLWTFDEFSSSGETNVSLNVSTWPVGEYYICLEATSLYGCRDFHCETLTIKESLDVFVPNAFTPDGDGQNDEFFPVSRKILFGSDYEFAIFSRWGELLFTSAESNSGWDGKRNGKDVQGGLYVWKLKIYHPEYGDKVMHGHVVLIR